MEKRQAIEFLEYLRQDRNLEGTIYGDALNMAIEALKAQLSKEGTTKDATSDLISRMETVEHLRRVLDVTVPITDYDEGYVDGVEFGISTVSTMPTIQPQSTAGQLNDSAQSTNLIDRQQAIDALDCINGVEEVLRSLPTIQPEPQWISVTERLPDNADHPGAFCPRYQVVTPYGVTEGWYRPHDHEKGGQWFALFWFMSQIYEIWNIDFERGDVPKVIGEAPVMEWRPMPEPYKPNEKQSGKEGA